MKLVDFLIQKNISQSEIAREIGCTQEAISHYVGGRRLPLSRYMKKIVQVTGGLVQPNDFYDTPPPTDAKMTQ